MTSKRMKISDKFDNSTCGVCGDCEINQYFGINDNFIEYNGTFYSLREILSSALDFQISVEDGTTTEICLDCKDKLVKFYHFKRKAKEIQKRKLHSSRLRVPKKDKQSKVVHNIVEIVENYTEKCSISSIRIDESSKKLIIEPQETETETSEYSKIVAPAVIIPHKQELPFEAEYISENSLNAVLIKQEPGLMIEENSFNDDDSMTFNEGTEQDYDEKDYSAGETSQQYYGDSSEPGTSRAAPRKYSRRRSRAEPNEDSEAEKLKEKRRRRMELLKLPNNHDLYERHKAQARERTRRYRAKMRQQKQLMGNYEKIDEYPERNTRQAPTSMNDFSSAGIVKTDKAFETEVENPQVKVENTSGDENIVFT